MVERFRREQFEMRPYEEGLWVRYSDYAALEAQFAERVKVEDVLDAASEYMKTQYGIGVLSHPTDRRRILSALEPAASELCAMEAYNAATKAMAARMANTAILVGDGEPSIDGEHTDADGYPYAFGAPEGQQEAARIGDAVLDWMTKYDLLDGEQEYYVADVIAVLDDLTPLTRPLRTGGDGGGAGCH